MHVFNHLIVTLVLRETASTTRHAKGRLTESSNSPVQLFEAEKCIKKNNNN